STELARLAHQLHDQYCVVHVDLGAGLPDRCGTLAILALLGAATLRAADDWRAPDGAPQDTARKALERSLATIGAPAETLGKLIGAVGSVIAWFDPPTGAGLGSAGKAIGHAADVGQQAAALRRQLDHASMANALSRDTAEAADAIVAAVNQALDALHSLSGRPPLLLADGLDKRVDLDDIKAALADVDVLTGLRAPLVLTGPITLRHDPRFRGLPGRFALESLPNVGVRRPDGGARHDGQKLLAELLRRRLTARGLDAALVDPSAVELAAGMSSGIVREFLDLICKAGELAFDADRRTIERPDIEAVGRRRRLELQGYLNEGSIKLLQRVLDKRVLPADPLADVLLYENLIACYSNGDAWFRPHELLVDWLTRAKPD
ncbi:MAG: hypothetical protein KC583_07780, partial [Myxococcales bacterium]|nr:hypothetical protein [Myxococcales bacterium]